MCNTWNGIQLEIEISHTTSKRLCEITVISYCYANYKEVVRQQMMRRVPLSRLNPKKEYIQSNISERVTWLFIHTREYAD